jgi:hypothetical protein
MRQIGITDLPRLRRIRGSRISLVVPEEVCHGHLDDVKAAFPLGRRFARAFIAESDDAVGVVVELRPEPEDFRWILTSMGAWNQHGEDLPEEVSTLWSELLGYAAHVAGRAGAKRVHASVPIDSQAQRTLSRAGFSVYGHQTVLLAHELHLANDKDASVRERDPSDAWSIHHLYHVTTPRPVQYAEALSSNHWDARRTLSAQTRGFVLDGQGELAGYCQIMNRGHCYALEILMAPDQLGALPSLAGRAIRQSHANDQSEVWITVPDYRREYLPMLESMGFREVARQALMVRYTMVPVNGYQSRWVNVVADVIERLPARSPVVTHSRDGA